uniref:immunoglobulin superfamily member 6 n=1 Tax=Geotrypetes seraphini TaxID=260995 RepID=UPI001458FEC8|nr:immunoglobulin superfamily member 6 [Geotrypetes seraphini]
MGPLGHLNLWRLKVILVLCGAGNIEASCRVTVLQESLIKAASTLSSATITCHFSATGCPSCRVFWFRYLANEPEDLCVPKCHMSDKFTATVLPQGSSLNIYNLHSNDSGIYICGVTCKDSSSTSKRTGRGTTLVVGDSPGYLGTVNVLLIVLLLLLFLYCTALLSIFLFIYQTKSKELKNREQRQTPDETEKHRSGRTVFRAIAQELYTQRYAHKSHQVGNSETDYTIYQNN